MPSNLNRRIHPRSLTDERAVVVFDGREQGCVVRDRSQGGARLVLVAATALPQRFELRTGGVTLWVEVIWSDGVQAGIRFVAP